MKQLMLLVEESQLAKQAKAKGLEYLGFGRWGKNGTTTHKSEKGRLVPVKKDDYDPHAAERARKDMGAINDPRVGQMKPEKEPYPKLLKKHVVEPYKSGDDPDNWWRDAFLAHGGYMGKDDAAKAMKNPKLAKSFKSLYGDYIKKDKTGNYVWPEQMSEATQISELQADGKNDFSDQTDTWFDDLSDYEEMGTIAMEDKALAAMRKLVLRPPTQNTLQQLQAVSSALGHAGVGKKIAVHIGRVLKNDFKGEFKKQYGDHSQASEVISLLRQALNYNK